MTHEYKMLRCRNEIYLSSEATKHLADGWELWGNPFMLSMDMENGWICQAMVRMAQEPASADRVAETGTAQNLETVPASATHTAEAAGFTVQVPETSLEIDNGPTVKVPILAEFAFNSTIQSILPINQFQECNVIVRCACFEKVGDNPQCRLHGDPFIHGGLAS